MKQKLPDSLSEGVLRALSLLTLLLMFGLNSANAETATLTLQKNDLGNLSSTVEASEDDNQGNSWTFTMTGSDFKGWDSSSGRGFQFGKKNEGVTSLIIKSTGFENKTISKVIVNTSCASGGNISVSVKVGSTPFLHGTSSTYKLTTSATDVEFTGDASGEVEISYAPAATADRALYVKSITVEYSDPSAEPTSVVVTPAPVNDEIQVINGSTVKFYSQNAEKLEIETITNTTLTKTVMGDTYDLIVNEPQMVTVTPVKGETVYSNLAVTISIKLKAAPLCEEVVFDPVAGEIVKGNYVTMTCEGAEQIKYWFNNDTEHSVTLPAAEAKVQINEACTLYATGINVDGKDGAESSASYTLKTLSAEDMIDTLTAETTGITNSYSIKSYTSKTTQVVYDVKAMKNNGIQINTPATNSAKNSGVLSIKNDGNFIIDKLIITISSSNTGKGTPVMTMSNIPGSLDKESAMNATQLNMPEDGVEIAGEHADDTLIYTYTPEASYKYFALTTTGGAIQIEKIEVYYQDPAKAPAAPELGEDVVITDGKISGETLTFKKVEGVSVWYKLTMENPQGSLMREPNAQGYTQYTYTEPVQLNTSVKSVSFYAVDDATGAKSVVKTYDVDVQSGIVGIEAEDGEAVYYNLQGVRVENPVKGLYIRVANGKSQKVIL